MKAWVSTSMFESQSNIDSLCEMTKEVILFCLLVCSVVMDFYYVIGTIMPI